ncbi:MAG: class I SAM-dependent methyltransferase [Terriglobales bacterium]
MNTQHVLDPVAAYDQGAAFFSQMSEHRRGYLRGVENLVVARILPGSRSLLDVGSGDGLRAARIAREVGLSEVVLLEPSREMLGKVIGKAEIWPIRAEDLLLADSMPEGLPDRRFDVITCLWNVIGHIRDYDARVRVLARFGELLPENGKLFFDVNHRYNVKSYGLTRTSVRFFGDHISPRPTNGDVEVRWRLGDKTCRTRGHVFTDTEVRRMVSAAGLVIEERLVVDYDSGKVRRFACLGNLLYVLGCRNSSNDPASASQTS